MKCTSREANFMFWGEVKGGEGHEEPGEGAAHRRGDDAAAAGRPGPRLFPHHYFPGKELYNPSLLLAYRIAELFGVTVEDLYCLKENRELEDRQYEDLQ